MNATTTSYITPQICVTTLDRRIVSCTNAFGCTGKASEVKKDNDNNNNKSRNSVHHKFHKCWVDAVPSAKQTSTPKLSLRQFRRTSHSSGNAVIFLHSRSRAFLGPLPPPYPRLYTLFVYSTPENTDCSNTQSPSHTFYYHTTGSTCIYRPEECRHTLQPIARTLMSVLWSTSCRVLST